MLAEKKRKKREKKKQSPDRKEGRREGRNHARPTLGQISACIPSGFGGESARFLVSFQDRCPERPEVECRGGGGMLRMEWGWGGGEGKRSTPEPMAPLG